MLSSPGEVRDDELWNALEPNSPGWIAQKRRYLSGSGNPLNGRRRSGAPRASAAPALLVISILSGGGLLARNRLSPELVWAELANLDILTKSDREEVATGNNKLGDNDLARAGTLLARLGHLLQSLDLSRTKVTDLEPLKGLTALQSLNLSLTKFTDLGPLKGLSALQSLYLSGTNLTDIEPLKGLTALQRLDLSRTKVTDLEPLKGLTALEVGDLCS